MASTREALRTALRDELKTDPNGKVWKDRELNRFLPIAYAKIQSDAQFRYAENETDPATQNSVVDQAEYDLETDFGRMEVVRYGDRPLTETTLAKIRRNTTTSNSGTPTRYYIHGTKLGLHPTPNEVKEIEQLYLAKLSFPTADDGEIDYDDFEIDSAIVKYAAYLAWSSPRGNKGSAVEKLDDYNEIMKSIKIHKLYRSRGINYLTQREPRGSYNPRALGGGRFR